MTLPRKILSFLAALGVIASFMSPAFASEASLEREMINLINQERAAHGLSELDLYWDLRDDARAHAETMMNEGQLYHNPQLGAVTTGYYSLGENVGVGSYISTLHTAFMDSSAHRANVLGQYNYIGVGVAQEFETKLWVTIVFMRGPEGLGSGNGSPGTTTPPPPEDPPPADDTTPPPADDPAPPADDATPPPADDGGDDEASNDGSGKDKDKSKDKDKEKKKDNKKKQKDKKKKAKEKNDKKRKDKKKGRRGCHREVPGGPCAG